MITAHVKSCFCVRNIVIALVCVISFLVGLCAYPLIGNQNPSRYTVVGDGHGGCELREPLANGTYRVLFHYAKPATGSIQMLYRDNKPILTVNDGFYVGKQRFTTMAYQMSINKSDTVEYIDLDMDANWDMRYIHSSSMASSMITQKYYKGRWINGSDIILHWNAERSQWVPRQEGNSDNLPISLRSIAL